jgi:hypothetical protein
MIARHDGVSSSPTNAADSRRQARAIAKLHGLSVMATRLHRKARRLIAGNAEPHDLSLFLGKAKLLPGALDRGLGPFIRHSLRKR